MSRSALVLSLGVSLLALAPAAHAQSAEASEPNADSGLAAGDEIVVSARRRSESIQDVPQTVNVVTAEQVEKLNLRSFQEIATIVPGLTMTQTSSFSSQATVRGVAFVPEASGNNPSVEFYLNDTPISSGFLFQSTYDFGQFELQRGPQGTLRGRAAPSGSIAVTVRRPVLDEAGVALNATITDTHSRKIDGVLNVPIIRDVLGVRIAGVVDKSRGNLVRSIKEPVDPSHNEKPYRTTESFRVGVKFEPTEWISANVMYQKLHSEDHSYAQVVSDSLYGGPAATTQVIRAFDRLSIDDQGSYGRQDHDVLVGNLDIRFAGQKLSYVGSRTKQAYSSIALQDAADYFSPPRVNMADRTFSDPAGFVPACVNGSSGLGVRPTTGGFFQCTLGAGKRESHELRLASDSRIAGIFDYVIGGFYDHNKNPVNLTQETPIVNTTTRAITTISRTAIEREGASTEKSVFGNLTAHLGAFELSGGLRYIDYKSDSFLRQGGALLSTQKDHDDAVVYLASAKYQITPDIMVYALTGSSWRPGPRVVGNFSVGANGQSGPSALERQFMNLPPERSKSYEIGAKTAFLDGRGRLNVSAYYQKFRNYPFRGPSVSYLNYRLVNGAPSAEVGGFNFVSPVPVTVKGIEADVSFRILPRWNVSATVAYSDGRIKNGTIACTDLDRNGVPDLNATTPTLAQLQAALPAGQNLAICSGTNRRALTSPKLGANLQSEYGFAIGQRMDGFVRGSASLFGSTRNDPTNTVDDVDSYGLLNLFAGLRDPDGAWEISLFGKNILRERQVLSVGSAVTSQTVRTPGSITYRSEYRTVSVTAPREFGLSAKIALGSR